MNKKILQNSILVGFLACICCFLWGSAFPTIKIGYRLFCIGNMDSTSQILFAGIRFTLAGILVIILGSILNKRVLLPQRDKACIYTIIKLSVIQTMMQYFFFYLGLARTPGVKSAIIQGSNTFFAIIIAAMFFESEKLNIRKIVGCIMGFVGVVLINLKGGAIDMNMSVMGEGFVLMSSVAYGLSSSLIKKYSSKYDTVMLSGYQFALGGMVMAIVGYIAGGRLGSISVTGILTLLYLSSVSAIAYTLWGVLLKYNSVDKVAIWGFMIPVFGVVLSAWWLKEGTASLGINAVVALLLVCIGIFVVNTKKSLKKKS